MMTMMRSANNDSLNSSIDSRHRGGNQNSKQLPNSQNYNPMSIPGTPSQHHNNSSSCSIPSSQGNPADPAYQQKKQQAEMFHSQGYNARKKGDYHMAIDFYSKALEALPTHFKALFNRGFAFDKIGEFDLAINDYSRAILIDPKNAFTYYNKGISLDRKGDFDEAIASFTKAIELEPSKADFYHNRGFAFRKKRDF